MDARVRLQTQNPLRLLEMPVVQHFAIGDMRLFLSKDRLPFSQCGGQLYFSSCVGSFDLSIWMVLQLQLPRPIMVAAGN
jgi:hypothetical protein